MAGQPVPPDRRLLDDHASAAANYAAVLAVVAILALMVGSRPGGEPPTIAPWTMCEAILAAGRAELEVAVRGNGFALLWGFTGPTREFPLKGGPATAARLFAC
jgi:hypothetical protein